jgi:ribonuclease HI
MSCLDLWLSKHSEVVIKDFAVMQLRKVKSHLGTPGLNQCDKYANCFRYSPDHGRCCLDNKEFNLDLVILEGPTNRSPPYS